MATTKCSRCKLTTVRLTNEVCGSCRSKGWASLPATDEPITAAEEVAVMDSSEPRAILEVALRQARVMQDRLQAVMDAPAMLLCVACAENPRAVEQVDVAYVLDQHVKMGKVLAANIPVWQKLQRDAAEAAGQLSREEMQELLIGWFGRLPTPVQREVLQAMTRRYNETQAMRPNERLGNG